MTYTVSSGTLNPTLLLPLQFWGDRLSQTKSTLVQVTRRLLRISASYTKSGLFCITMSSEFIAEITIIFKCLKSLNR